MKNSLGLQLERAQGDFSDFKWGSKSGRLYRKRDCKGFTLVELIVVIVILAILAAILVPALLGWIDKAKLSKYELEARSIAQAAQAEAIILHGKGEELKTSIDGAIFDGVMFDESNHSNELENIEKLSGIDNIKSVQILFKNKDGVLYLGQLANVVIVYTPAGENECTMWWSNESEEWVKTS